MRPCRLVSPVVESIGDKHADRLSVAKVNTDENQQLAMRYSIFSIPTLILFENGREAARLVGYMPQEVMEERLSQFLASRAPTQRPRRCRGAPVRGSRATPAATLRRVKRAARAR